MNSKLRVLYLTHHGPLPASSGGRLRDSQLIPELARLTDLDVWAVSRSATADRNALAEAPFNSRFRIFHDESSPQSYPSRDSAAARALLAAEYRRFDIIHIEGHYLFHLLPQAAHSRSIVVEHNVESHLITQAIISGSSLSANENDIESVRQAEDSAWTKAGLVLTLSEEDRGRILKHLPSANVRVTANGSDHISQLAPPYSSAKEKIASNFGFLANYAYPPNIDALGRLIEDIFPLIHTALPESRLLLAGSNLKSAVADRHIPEGVETVGWTESASSFFSDIDIALCPLRIGGGVKVKMLEMIRCAIPIVASPISLEGLPSEVRDGISVSDSTTEFASAAIQLARNGDLRLNLRTKLQSTQSMLPTWRSAAMELYSHWIELSRSKSYLSYHRDLLEDINALRPRKMLGHSFS